MLPAWPSIGQYLPLRQREQLPFGGNSTTLRNFPYLRLGITKPSNLRVLQYSGEKSQPLLNQAISFTERGTLRVFPFRPSLDFSVLTLCSPVLLTVFSATF